MGTARSVSWSFSRSRSFAACKRAHWFNYYASGEPEAKQAGILKTLISHEMLAGQVVDWQVNRALDAVRSGSMESFDLVDMGVATWTRTLAASALISAQMRSGRKPPSGAQPLLSDYYERPPDREREERGRERVVAALNGFLTCEVWEKVRKVPIRRWSPLKEPSELRAEKWQLEGIEVWSSLDLWLDCDRRGLVILDWKSSSSPSGGEAFQLATYSLWGQTARGHDRERILVQAVHLPDVPQWTAKPISEVEDRAARDAIKEDHSAELRRLSEGQDDAGSVIFTANRENFPPTPSVAVCRHCRFQQICPEGRQ